MADFSNLNINENTYVVKDAWVREEAQDLRTDVGDLQLNKEDVANKVTSITNDSTNTEYPSAKAVYTLVTGNDKFWEFTYGQPTYSDVAAKVTAGKIPWCYYNKVYYFLSWWDQTAATKYFVFGQSFYSGGMINAGIRLDDTNTWTVRTMVSSNTISIASTNLQTPTAKAVYDYVQTEISSVDVKLYRHNITVGLINDVNKLTTLSIITKSNTAMTISDLYDFLTVDCAGLQTPAGGIFDYNGFYVKTISISAASNNFTFWGFEDTLSTFRSLTYGTEYYEMTDTVVEVS